MKRFIKTLTAAILSLSLTVAVCACDFGGGSGGEQEKPQGVSYGTATVNYHYEYDVAIEHYWQEKYSIQSGKSYEITELYTPPVRAGYRFLGWTKEEGGEGELVGTPFSITGSGFGGTLYELYAKYEAIPFTVVYHLDGGENHPDNPTSLTGSQKLKDPTKEKHEFLGWYYDPEFMRGTSTASMIDDETTTVNLYAKWRRIYTISYVSDQEGLNVKGDQSYFHYTSFNEDSAEMTIILEPEYFENYTFLGWEVDGSEKLVQSAEITIKPSETKRDLTYTARYLKASNGANTPGLGVKVLRDYGEFIYYAKEEVTEIVVEDKYGSGEYDKTIKATVYYSGDTAPKVTCREGITVTLEKNPDEVANWFK